MRDANAQVTLTNETAIDNIVLLQNDWDFMQLQTKELQLQIKGLKTIINEKDNQIKDLLKIIESYKEFSEKIDTSWWQSPFFDVIFFVGGFALGVYAIITKV